MFIRIKNIKKNKYAYLVNNKWTKKGTRQKVSKYLGRVYEFNKIEFKPYYDYIDNDNTFINKLTTKELILSLIGWVLTSHGFSNKSDFTQKKLKEFMQKKAKKKKKIVKKITNKNPLIDKMWFNGNFVVDLKKLDVLKGKKSVVLNINGDFMCKYTLRKLIKFKSNKDQEQVALELAKVFINAGIPLPEEIFVHIYQDVYNDGQSYIK
jgi:hypothetical protein